MHVERFSPGQMVAERYRIVGLLGRGGMGEVYRADDLTLAQPVALKFLPAALSSDPQRVQRLLGEVRLTRQISHPGVCRVYDVHTIPGANPGDAPTIFLAMEFIDGEDLGSLLRRIGRLPKDKALEVARQVCAGLAAAHDQGVIHRDLKPTNIMLDGRGRARLTDFGVAGGLEEIIASGQFAVGTPAYMAPEQLSGQTVSVRSDIYSLGLVLYELFTGRPVFKAGSMAELRGLHATGDAARPSTIVDDLDPLVERVIMRCLEKDPAFRPSSALAVSASLPGGDPVAEALAAGETPSPEMVAASGGTGAFSFRFAAGSLALVLLGMFVLIGLKQGFGLIPRTPFELSTEVLTSKARDLLKEVAPPEMGWDSASGMMSNHAALRSIEARLTSPDRWESLSTGRPSGVLFWYRQSPELLMPSRLNQSRVQPDEPPMGKAGEALVYLDSSGRLLRFDARPKWIDRPSDPHAPRPPDLTPRPVDWGPFFRSAQVDPSALTPAEPMWPALTATDQRSAWTGEWPAQGAFSPISIRVEAASFEGKPVFFRVIAPWNGGPLPLGIAEGVLQVGQVIDLVIFLFTLSVGPLLAWRHARTGRGDRRGAWRLAVFTFLATWLYLILPTLRPASLFNSGALLLAVSRALWVGLFAWILYMALEPYIRRVAPWSIVSWTRMISGKPADALVGRDVLLGGLLACGASVVTHLSAYIPGLIGMPPPQPLSPHWGWLGGPTAVLSMILNGLSNAVFVPMYITLVMVGLKWVIRKEWGAIVALWVMGSFLLAMELGLARYGLLVGAIVSAGYAVALVKGGLLMVSATSLSSFLLNSPPVTANFSTWFAPNWLVPYGVVAAMMAAAAYVAVGGRAGVVAWKMARSRATPAL